MAEGQLIAAVSENVQRLANIGLYFTDLPPNRIPIAARARRGIVHDTTNRWPTTDLLRTRIRAEKRILSRSQKVRKCIIITLVHLVINTENIRNFFGVL